MKIPENLKYAKTHEWVEFTGEKSAKIGLTEFAVEALGGLVFIGLPAEGDSVSAGESFGEAESVKAVSDVVSPVSGTVTKVNEALQDAPEKIGEDPYGSWLIEVSEISGQEELLDAVAYEAFCKEEV